MSKNSVRTNKMIEHLKAIRLDIDERCQKEVDGEIKVCSRAEGEKCSVYAFPKTKWLHDRDCPMADAFLKTEIVKEPTKGKVRVGQQKQKKKFHL